MKFKKNKQKKRQQVPWDRICTQSATTVSWYNAQPTELQENCHEIESKFKSICIESTI